MWIIDSFNYFKLIFVSWCLECRIEFHENKTCEEYRKEREERRKATDQKYLDDEFFKAVNQLKYKPCPKCKAWIEKNEV